MSKIIDTQEKKDILETLKSLGLTNKESLVYFSLISLGEVGTSAIVSETSLHRQFVYDTLGSLEEKGLVSYSIVRGRKKFFNNPLSKLSTMFEYKKRIADELSSKIEKKMLPIDIQQFEVYRGQEAFVTNEFEILNASAPGSNMYIFGGMGDEYKKTLGTFFTEYEYQRIKKKIEVYYLGSKSQEQFLTQSKDNRNLFTYRLLPSAFTGDLNISVHSDRVSFNMFGSPVATFTIKSEKIAKSYADFFMGLWGISK